MKADDPDPLAPIDEEFFAGSMLREALEILPDAIVLFDADDRLLLWNSRYAEMYARTTPLARGMRFDEIMLTALTDGLVPDAAGREAEWIAERIEYHRLPSSSFEHRLTNGRWLRVQERRSADGWSIGVRNDITDIKQREASFRLLFEASPTPMYVADRATLGFVDVNAAALALYGYPRERFLAMNLYDIRPVREHDAFRAIVEDASLYDYGGERPWTHLLHDGTEITVLPHTKSLTLDGRPVLLSSIINITEQQLAEIEAKRARAFLNTVVDLIPVGVFVKDLEDSGRYLIYNRAGEALVGRSRDEIVGRTDDEIFDAEDAARFAAQDREVMGAGVLATYAEETVTRGGGEVRVITTRKVPILERPDGPPRYLLGVSEDVTERQRLAARLDHMAHHDALTGLPNRVVLDRRLGDLAQPSSEVGPSAILLYVDLDGFKGVNDTLGHSIGDGLLCGVAERMRAFVPAPDLAVRLGGDEFVLLLALRSPALAGRTVEAFAQDLVAALSAPYAIEGEAVRITASIGIALVGGEEGDPETWVRSADEALYAAKRAASGSVRLFSDEMDHEARAQRELAAEIERGLDRGEFSLAYAPVVATADGRMTGYAARLVWHHPARGCLEASAFLSLAEGLGLGARLGAWALRQACREAAAWPSQLDVAVRLSSAQLRDDGLIPAVIAALRGAGLAASRLALEMAEAALAGDAERSLATLATLRRLGTRLVLESGQGGASALALLERFPFDKIRIDGALVRALPQGRAPLAMLRATIAFARTLGIATLAGGVETAEQHAVLMREGCDEALGAWFEEAAPGESWLRQAS